MQPPAPHQEESRTARILSPTWWLRDQDGGLTFAQWPNPAIGVWLGAVVIGWTGVLSASREGTVEAVGRGALLVWGIDELLRGASPFRRLLGAGVLVYQLVAVLA